MKKALFTFISILTISAAFAQPCSLANLQINSYTFTDGKCYADIQFDMDRNNGNKFVYVHIWNAAEYIKVNKPRWQSGAGPVNSDINGTGSNMHPQLVTVAIDNFNNAVPVFSSYKYRPDTTVAVRNGTSVTVSNNPVSGNGPHAFYRFTITRVLLGTGTVAGGCQNSNLNGIVWSTQANSTNSHIHCSLIGANTATNPITVSGIASCPNKQYSLSAYNNTSTTKQATFRIYADNSGGAGGNPNGTFDPGVDAKFDSGYFAVNGNSTFTLTRAIPTQYLNFDLWAQVMVNDGTTQLIKMQTSPCGALPVSISTLSATRTKQNVSVKWQTASEQSVKGFAVERLTDAGWNTVGFVASKSTNGNSSVALSYEFTDLNTFKGISQYRLRVVDLDDKSKYSDIRTVKGENQAAGITIYPNPGRDGKVNVLFEEGNTIREITVVDMSGRVETQMKSVTATKVTITNLPAGIHVIKVVNLSNGSTDIRKISIVD